MYEKSATNRLSKIDPTGEVVVGIATGTLAALLDSCHREDLKDGILSNITDHLKEERSPIPYRLLLAKIEDLVLGFALGDEDERRANKSPFAIRNEKKRAAKVK